MSSLRGLLCTRFWHSDKAGNTKCDSIHLKGRKFIPERDTLFIDGIIVLQVGVLHSGHGQYGLHNVGCDVHTHRPLRSLEWGSVYLSRLVNHVLRMLNIFPSHTKFMQHSFKIIKTPP